MARLKIVDLPEDAETGDDVEGFVFTTSASLGTRSTLIKGATPTRPGSVGGLNPGAAMGFADTAW
ncbi:MAG: hypothetical protein HY720_22740 [Planctomycetes bacterium]|nr:hypothetical protein [Planctomycetota bacterium]